MAVSTLAQFDLLIAHCRSLFQSKHHDYGSAWRIFRLATFCDQLMIKARRIRAIQELKEQKISDTIPQELMGIINYAIMTLMQQRLASDQRLEISLEELISYYNEVVQQIRALLSNKNHDYQEIWKAMSVSSMVDIILMKLLRMKQILNNNHQTLVSEGIEGSCMDIVNYALFSWISLTEESYSSKS